MNLNEQNIYDNLESYRNNKGYNQTEMAEIVGLATKQAYSRMISNKTMKLAYLINLVNNSDISLDKLFDKSRSTIKQLDIAEEGSDMKFYSCPDCRPREKEIKMQAKIIKDMEYTINIQKELIENLKIVNEQCKKETTDANSSQYGEGAKGRKAG